MSVLDRAAQPPAMIDTAAVERPVPSGTNAAGFGRKCRASKKTTRARSMNEA